MKNISTKNKIHFFNDEFSSCYPNDDTPISYDSNQQILSRFKDDIWDFTYYSHRPTGKKKIYFDVFDNCNVNLKKTIIYEYKIIIYGFIFCNTNTAKSSSIHTILGDYSIVIKNFLRFAIECNTSLNNFSKNIFLIKKIFEYISFHKRCKFGRFSNLFKKLSAISIVFKNHDLSLNQEQQKHLLTLKSLMSNEPYKQFLVIPSRIYFKLNLFIDEILKNFDQHSIFLQKSLLIKNIKNKKFYDFIKENNIYDYCLRYKISSFLKLSHHFIYIANLAQIKLIMFSGMRHSEVLLLPFNCYEKINLNNKTIYILNGYTSKFTKSGPIKTSWITSSQVSLAINVLQTITKGYLKSINVDLNTIDHDKVPLATFSGMRRKNPINSFYDYPYMRIILLKNALDNFNFDSRIDSNDLKELKLTTTAFEFESYNFKIGSHFRLSPHQFRRSLTVYAARSGFVKIPALKAQLKHITYCMTFYYANNAMKTINLFDKDLIESFVDEQHIDQFINFKSDVMNSISKLYGGEGFRLQTAKQGQILPLFLVDEKTALNNIRDGKMSYRRTPLGGCSRKGSCEEIAELTITPCITCKDAIFSDRTISALKVALKNFRNQLQNLAPDSLTAIHLATEINQIQNFIDNRTEIIGE
ncbi:hypothetical protein MWMV2_MWMV2_01266 [Acinetobacter oleivorans]|uniref:Tyr recombinase domain-containing protein n=2 Tax=Acinetobacter TaxID=469 RepID=N9FFR6_9GAMM|nr:hypothetical protein [Acinetobacter beijerinckii]CAI3124865.1 hypothetical protein MWMV3_MWMV3_01266 [Acinetobacter oleivorans]ENW03714.1 hypothetical protein F933_03114 [Acinetobacter beijerinckii CIP 110307]CAI3125518.1 hypothetical protein MWMV13_MWMV13_01266 [Acinetobacter oleivorans]CAI3125520.1 hypothetical protein MWMV5_MWMV5_01266 [Acinetobacter oleivorans]CAI3125540.1 hypothetical protein MWMV12_MWMV12_01266 [Acinetobacter oleivorans]